MRAKFILSVFLITGCYGVNKQTSEIGNLNTDCLGKNVWVSIKNKHSVKYITDSIFIYKLRDFEVKTFKTEILYFDTYPKELIAISDDHYAVRYIFNPKISDQILDGMSSKLSEVEKKRIRNRIQVLLMNFQCDEGKAESLKLIND